ncbi:MAG: hypothetical protein QNK05_08875 [Myxococcota bacterium]|nr:hypothetical protein [Myxococcota bacterium]
MPVLPLIDLLILVAWTSLGGAVLLKLAHLTLALRLKVLGLGPFEFVMIAGVCLLFALALAARVWVRANEPRLLARSRGGDVEPDFANYTYDPEGVDARASGDRAAAS